MFRLGLARLSGWLLVWCALMVSPALAQESPGEQVRMSLERYRALLGRVERGGQTATFAPGSVTVTIPGTPGEPLEVTVNVSGRKLGEGLVELPLVPADVVLRSVQVAGQGAVLTRVAGMHLAVVDQQSFDLSLTYLVPSVSNNGEQHAMVPLPPMPSCQIAVTGAEGLSVYPGSGVQAGGGALTASLPATPAVLIRWGSRASDEAVRRVDYAVALSEASDAVDVTATIEVQVGSGRARVNLAMAEAALVDLREGTTPLVSRVEDGWHVAWVEGKGRHVLTARLSLIVDRSHGQPQIALHPRGAPMTRVEVNVAGKREIKLEPDVPLRVEITGPAEREQTRAVAHLPPLEEFTLRWTEAKTAPESQVRVNTDTFQFLTLQEGVLRSRVVIDYDVIHGKLKELPIALPEGVVLYKVEGEGIEDWRIFPKTETEPRLVRVLLGAELEAKARIELQLENVVPTAEGTPLSLPLVRPLGAFREGGVVALFDGDKVGFAPADITGAFQTVGEDAVPPELRQTLRDKISQAFKHVGEPGQLASKVATAKTREVRFDARVDTLYLVREGSITGQAVAVVEFKSGRRDKIIVSLPEGVAEPRITAPSLNKVEAVTDPSVGKGRKAYEIRFTQALEGAVQLDIEFDLILKKELGKTAVPDLQIHGAEVETGAFGIAAETGIEVQPGKATDLRRVTAEELPRAVRLRSELEVALGFQYAHVPWALELDLKRHQTVETLEAAALHVWLTTHALESGHVVTSATYEIANDERRFFRLTLPEGAQVLRVAVDGQKVKAVADDSGAIAIPIATGRTLRVDVVYEVRREALGLLGSVGLEAPAADLRVSDVQWLVRLPADRAVLGLSTELKSAEPYAFRPPTALAVDPMEALPTDAAMQTFLFTYAVQDPTQAPLSVALRFGGQPGPVMWAVLFLGALGALLAVTRRRALGLAFGAKHWALLGVGIIGLLLVAVLWGLGWVEGLVALVAVAAVGLWVRRNRPKDAQP